MFPSVPNSGQIFCGTDDSMASRFRYVLFRHGSNQYPQVDFLLPLVYARARIEPPLLALMWWNFKFANITAKKDALYSMTAPSSSLEENPQG